MSGRDCINHRPLTARQWIKVVFCLLNRRRIHRRKRLSAGRFAASNPTRALFLAGLRNRLTWFKEFLRITAESPPVKQSG